MKRSWSAQDLRELWKEYFKEHKHKITASASLFPSEDPSLLFTSAGMVPFKDYFSGRSKPSSARLASIQKCLRATDLESVGKSERHCSFFEMLGNFSFGAYFKSEAIQYAWDFSLRHLKLDPQRIYVTVYQEDSEAEAIWKREIGIDPKHIKALGKKDNWWGPAGDQGPCGPCSELYLDRGEEICKSCKCKNKNDCSPGGEGERFLEYWNLVFNEFYSDAQGKLHPLPQKGIDTGAGLERILALLGGTESIYETPEIQRIIHALEELSAKLRQDGKKVLYNSRNKIAFRVLSDHLRAAVFSIADGIFPANTGRGYVVRRIIRRALLYARELGIFKPLLHELVDLIVKIYGKAYPELSERKAAVQQHLFSEEKRFLETLELGLRQWQELLQQHQKEKKKIFSGKAAFILYDTYGFPLELTRELAEKTKLKLDLKAFAQEMQEQRLRSVKASQWKDIALPILKLKASKFLGYESYDCKAKVIAIIDAKKARSMQSCPKKIPMIVILDQTPFYAEGGGQLGDKGRLLSLEANGETIFSVEDTQKSGSLILHIGQLKSGKLEVNKEVQAKIDKERREGLALHHSATHLLNKALGSILGKHVLQTGSLVAPDYLRFDFSHPEKISNETLSKISAKVNAAISAKGKVSAEIMSLENARKKGAVATFGEKYGEEVRVISMASHGLLSKELCGGCHVKNTSELRFFHIVKESSPGAAKRRIEAIAGEQVRDHFQNELQQLEANIHKHNQELEKMAERARQENKQRKEELLALQIEQGSLPNIIKLLKKPEDIVSLKDKILQIKMKWESAQKQKMKLMRKGLSQGLLSQVELYLAQAQNLGSIRLLSLELPRQDSAELRLFTDKMKEKSRGIVILSAMREQEKCSLLFSADKTALKFLQGLDMSVLIREAAAYIDGSGGGRPDMAQAGGKNVSALKQALGYAETRIKGLLAATERGGS